MEMPADYVERWPVLSRLRNALDDLQDELSGLVETVPPSAVGDSHSDVATFVPKSGSEHLSEVRGGRQVRSRRHETVVREVGKWFLHRGASVSTPHPIDLSVDAPLPLPIEVRTARKGATRLPIRQAVGQILEYQHFLEGAPERGAILVNAEPHLLEVLYAESKLGLGILWWISSALHAGPRTKQILKRLV